jgi:hypothetical protein
MREIFMNTEDVERERLKSERARLDEQQSILSAQQARLEGTSDLEALQVHAEMLRTHHDQLDAWNMALESFHARFGPIGD